MQQAALLRRERQLGVVVRFMWFCCFGVLSAIISVICERYWGSFYVDRLSTLACYSPADSADNADRNAAGLHYYAEKDRLIDYSGCCCLSAIISERYKIKVINIIVRTI